MRIAVLEDDTDQATRVSLLLQASGHVAHLYERGRQLLAKLPHESYDLIIIDWEIPDISGFEVLRRARAQLVTHTPVLFLTHRDSEQDIVQALEAGADDFLVKPHRDRELLARISALVRRSREDVGENIEVPPYSLDVKHAQISRDSIAIDLTRREFELALFFFRNVGKVVSRGHILQSVWGKADKDVTTRTVDTHVSRLRAALQLSAENGVRLTPVYGYGYRLETTAKAQT
jgi:DNA-binding response OmpR family regulator